MISIVYSETNWALCLIFRKWNDLNICYILYSIFFSLWIRIKDIICSVMLPYQKQLIYKFCLNLSRTGSTIVDFYLRYQLPIDDLVNLRTIISLLSPAAVVTSRMSRSEVWIDFIILQWWPVEGFRIDVCRNFTSLIFHEYF